MTSAAQTKEPNYVASRDAAEQLGITLPTMLLLVRRGALVPTGWVNERIPFFAESYLRQMRPHIRKQVRPRKRKVAA